MPRFLSDEWVAGLAAAAADPAVAAAADRAVVVEQRVHCPDGTVVTWHLRVQPGTAVLAAGPAGPEAAGTAHVVIEQPEDLAVALATGSVNAQHAFISGRLQVHGAVDALPGVAPVLAALDAAASDLRAATTYPTPAAGRAEP